MSLLTNPWKVILLSLSVCVLASAVTPTEAPLLEVRLQNFLTSYASPSGSPIRCVVIRSLEQNGRILVPEGSVVYGTVVRAQRVGLGVVHERAKIQIHFTSIWTPDGSFNPIKARLVSIDNAREKVLANGTIQGVLAANNTGNLFNGFWVKPTGSFFYRSAIGLTGATDQVWEKFAMGPIGMAGMFVVRCTLFPFPQPEIRLPAGTDMKLELESEPHFSSGESSPPTPEIEPALAGWLSPKLSSLYFKNGKAAGDLMNVVVFGTRDQIEAAFAGAGWVQAAHRSLRTLSRVYGAFSSRSEYANAPVSRLYVRGREPDLVFEKSLDTVTQRHHVRFWYAGSFEGQEAWLGAATHDNGIGFKLKTASFTHTIERNIDTERDKVSTDLTFAHCAARERSMNGLAASELYGHSLVATDGKIVVLSAQACSKDDAAEALPKVPGTKLAHIVQRVILEARNYVMRDNAYYWTYRIIRTHSLSKAMAQ